MRLKKMMRNDSPVSKVSLKLMKIQKTNLTSLEPRSERSSPYYIEFESRFSEMWFLTVDPLVRISVFTAKLSYRQYCWRVLEDFHCQEYTQFIDIHNCLFLRLHFTVGYYDYGRTTRFRQSIHSALLKSFLMIICIDAPESTTNSLSSGSRFDASTHLFSEGEKNAALFFSLNFDKNIFGPASTLLHGHLALATLSLPEIDPQIWEHWGYADEVHLGK